MKLSVFTKVKVGNFLTYMRELTNELPEFLSWEREELVGLLEEMERRHFADRRNFVLRELMDADMPQLRTYINALGSQLRVVARRGAMGENDAVVLKLLKERFRHRRKLDEMVIDGLFLAEMDAPDDSFAADIFALFKEHIADMDVKLRRCAEEEARIKAIGGCQEIMDKAMLLLRTIKDRAVGATYERGDEERQNAGRAVIEELEMLITNARRLRKRKRRKKGEDALKAAGEEMNAEGECLAKEEAVGNAIGKCAAEIEVGGADRIESVGKAENTVKRDGIETKSVECEVEKNGSRVGGGGANGGVNSN